MSRFFTLLVALFCMVPTAYADETAPDFAAFTIKRIATLPNGSEVELPSVLIDPADPSHEDHFNLMMADYRFQTEGKPTVHNMDKNLIVNIAAVAQELGCNTFEVTSGYRTKAHQHFLVKQGKTHVREGTHQWGEAVDGNFICENGKRANLDKVLKAASKHGFTGFGKYASANRPFTHIDVRDEAPAAWGVSGKLNRELVANAYVYKREHPDYQIASR